MLLFAVITTLRPLFYVEAESFGRLVETMALILMEGERMISAAESDRFALTIESVDDGVSPRHAHDCDACTFVGRDGDSDCYVCGEDVIRRDSSEPADYRSVTRAVADCIPLYRRVLELEDDLNRLAPIPA